jgi:hypothetical protein
MYTVRKEKVNFYLKNDMQCFVLFYFCFKVIQKSFQEHYNLHNYLTEQNNESMLVRKLQQTDEHLIYLSKEKRTTHLFGDNHYNIIYINT